MEDVSNLNTGKTVREIKSIVLNVKSRMTMVVPGATANIMTGRPSLTVGMLNERRGWVSAVV
jgi:hypothetical protein